MLLLARAAALTCRLLMGQIMTLWVRFEGDNRSGLGTLEGYTIAVHAGDLFDTPQPTGETVDLGSVRLRRPCDPTKMIGLWNNFGQLAAKIKMPVPPEPLYFLKNPVSFADPGAVIRHPASYNGKVVYEGELGIVVGRRIRDATEDQARAAIFGYTCVNDLTALDIIARDATFAQWTRAKGFDGFGPFGPAIATGLDPRSLTVVTRIDGKERQNYPISDMVFAAADLVARLSRDMTLNPGDIISCGTSLGVGALRQAETRMEVEIAGIGTLVNTFVQEKGGTA